MRSLIVIAKTSSKILRQGAENQPLLIWLNIMTNDTTSNVAYANDAHIVETLRIMEELQKAFLEIKPSPTFYSIDPQPVVLPEGITTKWVSISGWSNGRYVFIDRKKNETYFQVTSESNGCERCRYCQERMRLVGWKTRYNFFRISGYFSLYQRLPGTPTDLSVESLKEFLDLPIVK